MSLFCLPHAGSGAAVFYRWKRLLPPTIDVRPVFLPGRDMRLADPLPPQVEDVVRTLTDAAQKDLDLPYAIFGHSMGALLAYEWARRIHTVGLPRPRALFLSGRNAAHLSFCHRRLHLLPDNDLVAHLEQRYGAFGSTLADPELRSFFLPTLRADLKLVESHMHSPGEPLDCPILVVAGREDPSVSATGLAAWAELTRGLVTVERSPGDHFYHVHPDHCRALTRTIAATLTREAAI